MWDNNLALECEECRAINEDELLKMNAKSMKDLYNSILGLSQPPSFNSNYTGKFHHGWKDLVKLSIWTR